MLLDRLDRVDAMAIALLLVLLEQLALMVQRVLLDRVDAMAIALLLVLRELLEPRVPQV